jgi:hypothetical protein
MEKIEDSDIERMLNYTPFSIELKKQISPFIKELWPKRNSAPKGFPKKQLNVDQLIDLLKTDCFKIQIFKDIQGPLGRPDLGLEERVKKLNEAIEDDPDPEFMKRARDQFLRDKALYFTDGIFSVFRDNIIQWSGEGEPLMFDPKDSRFNFCNKDLSEIKTAEDIIATSKADAYINQLKGELKRLKKEVSEKLKYNKKESSPLGDLIETPNPPIEMMPMKKTIKSMIKPTNVFGDKPQSYYGTSKKHRKTKKRKHSKRKTRKYIK